jgi:hypothetical protein
MSFEEKYLKYKNKYLNLKNQIGMGSVAKIDNNKLVVGKCYNIVSKYGADYVGEFIEEIADNYYFYNGTRNRIASPKNLVYKETNCILYGKLSTEKCYKKRSDGSYLGHFVKTVDDYPDGPWRGGSTTHYFTSHSGEVIKINGTYNSIYEFLETNCK